MSENNQGGGDRAMEVEALRQITGTLALFNTHLVEDRRLLNDIHERVMRIESNRLEAEVAILGNRVDRLSDRATELEHAEIRRDAQLGVAGWISEKLPWLVAIFITAAAIVGFDKFVAK